MEKRRWCAKTERGGRREICEMDDLMGQREGGIGSTAMSLVLLLA